MEAVAEYLFNLFDANLTDEYQILASFEERACQAFATPPEDGYTFEQEALHREFCALFEGFTEGFLKQHGVSEASFQQALQAAMRDREEAFPTAVAEGTLPLPWEEQGNSVEEIISVLGEVADFRRWAASMRQLHTSNAIAAQFGGDALLSRKGAA